MANSNCRASFSRTCDYIFDIMEKMLVQNGVKKVQLLPAVNDDHGGVIIELEEPVGPNVFHNMLRSSLHQWKLQEGFWYHHAEPHYLMLVYWIPKTENTIPANASHRVGIGAIVLNEKRELLVVQEGSGKMKVTGIWKIPTGVVEEGEDVFNGAVREVKEETGIDTEFLELLAFRQMHNSFFGKSDLFFICMMRPLTFNLQKQDLEIEAAQWMSLEEYAAQPFVMQHGIMRYIKDLCIAKAEGCYPGFTPVPIKSYLGDPMSYLYFNEDGLVQEISAIHL